MKEKQLFRIFTVCFVLSLPMVSMGTTQERTQDYENCRAMQEPSVDCIKLLFQPLKKFKTFSTARASRSYKENGFYIAKDFKMTAIHVLEGNSAFPSRCFYDRFQFFNELTSTPGCGEVLFIGGDSVTKECVENGIPMSGCADLVDLDHSFDVALSFNPTALDEAKDDNFLQISKESPKVGDRVYTVGDPIFLWLSDQDRDELQRHWAPNGTYGDIFPLVSEGEITTITSRSIVSTAPVFKGNSGGPLLNQKGEVVGILYSKTSHNQVTQNTDEGAISVNLSPSFDFFRQLQESIRRAKQISQGDDL